jgi:hypothetical protein
MITRDDLDMPCSYRPAIEEGHESLILVDDVSIELARRDLAKDTFTAHVASLKSRAVSRPRDVAGWTKRKAGSQSHTGDVNPYGHFWC